MGMVSAWEEFIERSLVRYVAGAQTDGNYSPTHKYGQADTITHAYELLSQDANYDPEKKYLKVSDPRWVWRTADFFFQRHPYGCLQSKSHLLKHANSIRNRVAHDSLKCKAEFKATVLYFLQPHGGLLTRGYGPGILLLEPIQRHFSQQAVQGRLSHFDAYVDLYESLANAIVP